MESCYVIGTEFQSCKWKDSREVSRNQLDNNVYLTLLTPVYYVFYLEMAKISQT
jgi:hypothetical protein